MPAAPDPTASSAGAASPASTVRWWTVPRWWTPRQWAAAGIAFIATVLLVGIPTAVIPNPVFGRAVEPTWWSLPVLLVTGVLGGLLLATYVRPDGPARDADSSDGTPGDATAADESVDRPAKWGTVGGFLAYFAIGCPVCNKLVLIALGSSGALTWFAPVQPLLALASIVVLAVALRARLRGSLACPVVPVPAPADVVEGESPRG